MKSMKNIDYSKIDVKIRTTIKLLNAKGYETEYSCQGHIERFTPDTAPVLKVFPNGQRLVVSERRLAPYISFRHPYPRLTRTTLPSNKWFYSRRKPYAPRDGITLYLKHSIAETMMEKDLIIAQHEMREWAKKLPLVERITGDHQPVQSLHIPHGKHDIIYLKTRRI